MLETEQLYIRELQREDAEFIFRLVNSPGWIKFIGARNVRNVTDAKVFIKHIIDTPEKEYFPIFEKVENVPVGILSFIKRGSLDHPDFGFAMLPEYCRKGYCFEASTALLNKLLPDHPTILAITKFNNLKSMKLLGKLGFQFHKQTENGELLNHYLIKLEA